MRASARLGCLVVLFALPGFALVQLILLALNISLLFCRAAGIVLVVGGHEVCLRGLLFLNSNYCATVASCAGLLPGASIWRDPAKPERIRARIRAGVFRLRSVPVGRKGVCGAEAGGLEDKRPVWLDGYSIFGKPRVYCPNAAQLP